MEINSDKIKKKMIGNTLDYYNEDMSFKAVDRLLNKTINSNDNDEIAVTNDNDEIYLKKKSSIYYDEGDEIVQGFEKRPKKFEEIKKQVRKNYDVENYESRYGHVARRDQEDPGRQQTIGDRLRQQRENRYQDYDLYRNSGNCMSNVSEQTLRDRAFADRSKNMSRLYEARGYDFNYEDKNTAVIKNLTIGVFFVFLGVLSFLVYKINILSRDIENPMSTVITFKGKEYNLENLVSENEDFSKKIDKLEQEINSLQNEIQSVFANKGNSNINIGNKERTNTDKNVINRENINTDKNVINRENINTDKNMINKENTNDKRIMNREKENLNVKKNMTNNESIYNNLEEEFLDNDMYFEDEGYIVQAGDSLSRISQKFYGSKGQIQRIKDANNLKSDNLKEGQILKIPKY